MAAAIMITIFAQVAGHQMIASTKIARASSIRQKHSFKEITPLRKEPVQIESGWERAVKEKVTVFPIQVM